MQLDLTELNLLAVLIAVIINQGVGALWYSPILFGNSWLDLVGLKKEDIESMAAMRGFIFSVVFALVIYTLISIILILLKEVTWLNGAITGLIISLILSLQLATNYLYENRSIKLYLINAFYPIICYTAGGAVIGAF